MPFDDQRGRTSGFSASLHITPPGGPGTPGPIYSPGITPSFLGGGESAGFLQGGGNGGGFTNFSQYLMANPGGAGDSTAEQRTPGMTGLDAAMNNVYGVHDYGPGGPPPPPPPGGDPPPTGGPTGTPNPVPGPIVHNPPPTLTGGGGPPSPEDTGNPKRRVR